MDMHGGLPTRYPGGKHVVSRRGYFRSHPEATYVRRYVKGSASGRRSARYTSRIFPGLRMLFGSNARLSVRSISSSAGEREKAR